MSGDFDTWSQTPCKRETNSFGAPASPAEPSGRELVARFGSHRDLLFCGGDAVLEALGWPRGATTMHLRYEPGPREIITQCQGSDPRMSIDSGAVWIDVPGAGTISTAAELDADLRKPEVVRLYGDGFSKRCDLQMTAWVVGDVAEVCLSLQGERGDLAYASFRTRCE
ncbi:MAG: hypothetical protein QM784_18750 [Polyangiaceae bacterium]